MPVRIPRIATNATSLLLSDVVSRAATFALYAMIARFLGVVELGQMALGLTLFYIGQVVAAAGLKTLITRDVAHDKSRTTAYIANCGLIAFGSSVLAMLAIQVFARGMDYSAETRSIIFWLSVALIPFSLSAVCEGVFQAHEEMRYIAWGSVPVNVLKVCAAFVLLWTGAGLDRVLVLIVACHIAIMSTEWWLMVRRFPLTSIAINPRFASSLARSTSTFLGIDVVTALFGSLEILLLSRLATEADVGVFSAAVQVLLPVTLLFQNVVASAFPTLCRHFQSGVQSLRQTAAELVGLLLAISLPAALALFWVADWVLALLYGDPLQAAATPLRILAWCLVLRAVTAALGQVLLASRRERVTLRIVTVDALTSFTVGLLLIPHFGVVGAAITALATRAVDLTQHVLAVAPVFSGYSLSLRWAARLRTASMRLWTE